MASFSFGFSDVEADASKQKAGDPGTISSLNDFLVAIGTPLASPLTDLKSALVSFAGGAVKVEKGDRPPALGVVGDKTVVDYLVRSPRCAELLEVLKGRPGCVAECLKAFERALFVKDACWKEKGREEGGVLRLQRALSWNLVCNEPSLLAPLEFFVTPKPKTKNKRALAAAGACLHFLSRVATMGGAIAREVLLRIAPHLPALASIRKWTDPSPRENFVNLFLALISTNDLTTTRQVIEIKNMVNSMIFSRLEIDSNLWFSLVERIRDRVLGSRSLGYATKSAVLNKQVIVGFAKCYGNASLRTRMHAYLMGIVTPVDDKTVLGMRHGGASIAQHLLESLSPANDELQFELCAAVLQHPHCDKKVRLRYIQRAAGCNLEPKLSHRWMCAAAFACRMMRLDYPAGSFIGVRMQSSGSTKRRFG